MCSILYDSNIDKKNLKLISKLDIDEFVKEHVSPFNYTNYEFITDNKVDIKDNVIRYAESILERAHNQLKINNYVNNIYIAYKIETSVFEFSLIYCLNNNLNDHFIKAVYDDKFNSIIANLTEKKNISESSTNEAIAEDD